MRNPLLLLCACLLASSCAGASARYGCPAPSGLSCRSVSRVHSDVVSGGYAAEDAARGDAERKRTRRGRPRLRGSLPAAAPTPRAARERGKPPGAVGDGEPVYVAPRAVRVWIAPWRDSDGMFHSAKYVYALPERGTWRVGGGAVPAEDPPGRGRRTLRLRGTEGRR